MEVFRIDDDGDVTRAGVEGELSVTSKESRVGYVEKFFVQCDRRYGSQDATGEVQHFFRTAKACSGSAQSLRELFKVGLLIGRQHRQDVQDVDIELNASYQALVDEGSVFTLKDKDDYIIASIVLGEAQGSTANYAFILTDAKSEGIEDGEYMWEFDAVLNGVKQTLTARSKYPSTISDLDVGEVQELRFDGDYVISVKDIPAADIYNTSDYRNGIKIDDEEVYFVDVDNRARGEALRPGELLQGIVTPSS